MNIPRSYCAATRRNSVERSGTGCRPMYQITYTVRRLRNSASHIRGIAGGGDGGIDGPIRMSEPQTGPWRGCISLQHEPPQHAAGTLPDRHDMNLVSCHGIRHSTARPQLLQRKRTYLRYLLFLVPVLITPPKCAVHCLHVSLAYPASLGRSTRRWRNHQGPFTVRLSAPRHLVLAQASSCLRSRPLSV